MGAEKTLLLGGTTAGGGPAGAGGETIFALGGTTRGGTAGAEPSAPGGGCGADMVYCAMQGWRWLWCHCAMGDLNGSFGLFCGEVVTDERAVA